MALVATFPSDFAFSVTSLVSRIFPDLNGSCGVLANLSFFDSNIFFSSSLFDIVNRFYFPYLFYFASLSNTRPTVLLFYFVFTNRVSRVYLALIVFPLFF